MGLLHDSDVETIIWKQIFNQLLPKHGITEAESCLCLTTPPIIPDMVLNRYGEMIFEDFGFGAFYKTTAALMAREQALSQHPELKGETVFVVDSGFSSTYGVPIFAGHPMPYAATRIDVGGKFLTNLLNELVSYKEFNMTGETWLVNEIKEQLCYVSASEADFH